LGAVAGVTIETLQPSSYVAACLAAADALHLGRVQRIDLRSALALLVLAHTLREIEERAEAVFEHCVALDLAADVAVDAAEPGAQEFELSPGALELMRMRSFRAVIGIDFSRRDNHGQLPSTVEIMADRSCSAIRTLQPRGPYHTKRGNMPSAGELLWR
jgi:hypothetical protein